MTPRFPAPPDAPPAQQVVYAYFNAMAQKVSQEGDGVSLYDMFAPDATWTFPGDFKFSGIHHGRDAIFNDFFAQIERWFEPVFGIEDLVIMGDGPRVAAEYVTKKR